MDETLTRVAIDVSNRPYLVWKVEVPKPKLGEMDTELFKEWFQAFAQNAGVCLHVENLYGANSHHIVESCFKGTGAGACARRHAGRAAGGRRRFDQGRAGRGRIRDCLTLRQFSDAGVIFIDFLRMRPILTAASLAGDAPMPQFPDPSDHQGQCL